jgi:hypothetical protein
MTAGPLSPEQDKAVRAIVQELVDTDRLVEAATRQARESAKQTIADHHEQLLTSLTSTIADAVKETDKAIVSVSSGQPPKRDQDSKWFKLALVLLPVLMTVVITFFVNSEIESLKTQYALTQEVFRQKLTTYQQLEERMAAVVQSLFNAAQNPDTEKGVAIDRIRSLFDYYSTHVLFVGEAAGKQLLEFVDMAGDVKVLRPTGNTPIPDVVKQASRVEEEIAKDLKSPELGRIGNLPFVGQGR